MSDLCIQICWKVDDVDSYRRQLANVHDKQLQFGIDTPEWAFLWTNTTSYT